jgi:hypothetical protein
MENHGILHTLYRGNVKFLSFIFVLNVQNLHYNVQRHKPIISEYCHKNMFIVKVCIINIVYLRICLATIFTEARKILATIFTEARKIIAG